jgi:hypothetical protein
MISAFGYIKAIKYPVVFTRYLAFYSVKLLK